QPTARPIARRSGPRPGPETLSLPPRSFAPAGQSRRTSSDVDHNRVGLAWLSSCAMRRVSVFGHVGTGKTTFARALAARLNVPYIELDALHWGPGWTPATAEVMRDRVREAIAGDAWVVDGSYLRKIGGLVWTRADTLVWLDP